MAGQYQNEIATLPVLSKNRYETLFRVYNVEDTPNNFFYYNITKGIKLDIDNIDETYIFEYIMDRDMPWTTLAARLYGSMFLWWLIKILNPDTGLFSIKSGTKLKLIRPEFLEAVLDSIQNQIKV